MFKNEVQCKCVSVCVLPICHNLKLDFNDTNGRLDTSQKQSKTYIHLSTFYLLIICVSLHTKHQSPNT